MEAVAVPNREHDLALLQPWHAMGEEHQELFRHVKPSYSELEATILRLRTLSEEGLYLL